MKHLTSNCWADSATKKGEDYDEAEELLRVARTLSTWRDTIASPSQQHQCPIQRAVESDVTVVDKNGDNDGAEKWDKGGLREGNQDDNDSTKATVAGSEEMHSETASSPNLPSDTNSVSSVQSSAADPHCTKASEVHYVDLSYASNPNPLNCPAIEVNNQVESKSSLTNNGTPTAVIGSLCVSNPDQNNLASKFIGNEITICTVNPSDAVNIDLSSRIQKNAAFSSFEEFNQAFTAWKLQYHHPFRVASSETLRQPDDGVEHKIFKYRYIVYHCAFYGEPRKRGVGKRPKQTYMPCGCRAMLRLNHNSLKRALVITTLNSVHQGHDVSADNFARVSMKIRKLSPNSDDNNSEPSPGSARSVSLSLKYQLSSPINILTATTGECGAKIDRHQLSASERSFSRTDDSSLVINCSPQGTEPSSSSSTSSTADSQYNAHYHQLPQVSPLIDASSAQKFTMSATKKVGRYSNTGSGHGQLSAITNRPSNRSSVPYQDSIELSLMAAVAKASPSSTAASHSLTSSSSSSAPLPSPMSSGSEQHHSSCGKSHDPSVVSSTADYSYKKSAGIGIGLNSNGPLPTIMSLTQENDAGMRNTSTVKNVISSASQPPTSSAATTKFTFSQSVMEENVTFAAAPSSTTVYPPSSRFNSFNDAKASGAMPSLANNINLFGSLMPESGGNTNNSTSSTLSAQQQIISMLLSFMSSNGNNMQKPNLQQSFNTIKQQPTLKNRNDGLLLALKEMNANGNNVETGLDFGTRYNQPVFASNILLADKRDPPHGVHQQMNVSSINSSTGSNSCEQFLSLLRGSFNGSSASNLNQSMVNGNLLPQSPFESQLKNLQSLQQNHQTAEEMSGNLLQHMLPINAADSRTLLSNNLSLLDLMQPLTNGNFNKSLPAAPQQQTHGHILQLIDQLKQRQTHQSSGNSTSTMATQFSSTNTAAFPLNSKPIDTQTGLLLDSSSRQTSSIINAILQANLSTNKDSNDNGSVLENIKRHIKSGEDLKNLEMLEQRFQDTGKSAAESLLESVFEEGKLLVQCILDRMYGAPNVVEFVARLKQFVDSLPPPNLPPPTSSSSTFRR